ncbi:MAG: hypothetical protein AAF628_15495 [Planctomycetota bacterium]
MRAGRGIVEIFPDSVYGSDLDRAIDFCTVTLGLELRLQASDHGAEVGAANSRHKALGSAM